MQLHPLASVNSPLVPIKYVFPLILVALFTLYLSIFSEAIYDYSINRAMLTTLTSFFLISIISHSSVAKLFKKRTKNEKSPYNDITSALLFLLIHFFISFIVFRYVYNHSEMHTALLATGGTAIGYHHGLHYIQKIQGLEGIAKSVLSSSLGSLIGYMGAVGVYQIISLFNDQLSPSDLLNYSFSVIILGIVLLSFIIKKFKTVNVGS